MRHTIGFLTFAIGCTLSFGSIAPSPKRPIVDNGKFFTPETLRLAEKELKKIQKDFKKSVLIETVATVPLDANAEVTREANPEFMAWAKQRLERTGPKNLYVVISKDPGYVMAAVGSETKTKGEFTEQDRNVLIKVLAENFQQQNYQEGLIQGVQFIQVTLNNFKMGTPNRYQFVDTGDQTSKEVAFLWKWIGFGCAGLLAFLLISGLLKGLRTPSSSTESTA